MAKRKYHIVSDVKTIMTFLKNIFSFGSGCLRSRSRNEHERILERITSSNYTNEKIYFFLFFVFELQLILFFDLPALKSPSTEIPEMWRTYLADHVSLLALASFFLAIAFIQKKKKGGIPFFQTPLIPWTFLFVFLSLMAILAVHDLQYSGKLASFMTTFIISACFIPVSAPWNLAVFGMPLVLLSIGQSFLSIGGTAHANVAINTIFTFIASIIISSAAYKNSYEKIRGEFLLREANEKLNRLATQDSLTGLANRRFFEEHIDRELKMMHRNGRDGFLLLLDIDHFKQINDHHGHDTGDRVLKRIGEIIAGEIRDIDIAARWGGEEFIFFFPETTREAGTAIAERLRKSISQITMNTAAGTVAVAGSFGGFCVQARTDSSLDGIFKEADALLYASKEAGRNRVSVGPPLPPVSS